MQIECENIKKNNIFQRQLGNVIKKRVKKYQNQHLKLSLMDYILPKIIIFYFTFMDDAIPIF